MNRREFLSKSKILGLVPLALVGTAVASQIASMIQINEEGELVTDTGQKIGIQIKNLEHAENGAKLVIEHSTPINLGATYANV